MHGARAFRAVMREAPRALRVAGHLFTATGGLKVLIVPPLTVYPPGAHPRGFFVGAVIAYGFAVLTWLASFRYRVVIQRGDDPQR